MFHKAKGHPSFTVPFKVCSPFLAFRCELFFNWLVKSRSITQLKKKMQNTVYVGALKAEKRPDDNVATTKYILHPVMRVNSRCPMKPTYLRF